MHANFWYERWSANQIGFHESAVNPLLLAHLDALALRAGARIFLPLCGKTLDIDWLLGRGFRVVGVELSALAVDQLFERLQITPRVSRDAALELRSAPSLDVFVGDFFALTAAALAPVDAVYDRASLIALPAEMRRRYVAHLQDITDAAPQLLVTLDYDQSQVQGPPFSVPAHEVRASYAQRELRLLASNALPGGLKGKCPATENVWALASGRAASP